MQKINSKMLRDVNSETLASMREPFTDSCPARSSVAEFPVRPQGVLFQEYPREVSRVLEGSALVVARRVLMGSRQLEPAEASLLVSLMRLSPACQLELRQVLEFHRWLEEPFLYRAALSPGRPLESCWDQQAPHWDRPLRDP